ncbi:MAG TPA: DUF362 domain-containing protein [Bryobacteraceae bacterium]|nr:DUF362 domain-containing protein [Bryobacteraceae bacterium]
MTTRRQFLLASAAALTAASQTPAKSRIGFVHSTHKGLAHPASPGDDLNYELVRDMVWKAIGYGTPKAGSLEAKIKPGSWVVLKINTCFLPGQPMYRTGDVTDFRVWKAVMEYLARNSRARRITLAEGGSYRNMTDTSQGNIVMQDGQRVTGSNIIWGPEDFPGVKGNWEGVIKDFAQQFPDKTFDFVDLAYDVKRDEKGEMLALPVPVRNGVGSFSNKKEYYVTNTVLNCDFLISVPVVKVHENCGMTCCFKNYVGTGPRIAYGARNMTNNGLHNEHSVDTRIDPFIGDLSTFHPPDYNVVDFIRGLQYTEHNNRQADQMVRTNVVMAGEDPVAVDAIAATAIGYNPADIDYLHMAVARGIGTYDLSRIDVAGDDPGKFAAKWGKPRTWYARCNRDWRVTGDPSIPPANWKKATSFGDMLDLVAANGAEAPQYVASATVRNEGTGKGFLRLGLTGKATVELNGRQIMQEEGVTRFRPGQFQQAIELQPGDNQVVIRVQPADGKAAISALIAGPENNGDSLKGATWSA